MFSGDPPYMIGIWAARLVPFPAMPLLSRLASCKAVQIHRNMKGAPHPQTDPVSHVKDLEPVERFFSLLEPNPKGGRVRGGATLGET